MKIICTGLFLLSFFINSISIAQEISVTINSATTKKAVLFELEGEKTSKIDSVLAKDESSQFSLNNKQIGCYRLQFDNRHRSLQNKAPTGWLDFINDGKDVGITTDYNNIFKSLKVIKSESNRLYYKFIKLNKAYKTKSDLLQLILARYPKDDNYYITTQVRLREIQKEYHKFIEVTLQDNSNSFISRYIRSAQLPIVPISIANEYQLIYLKSHALDNVNFNDAGLIYSDAFTNKTIEYLTYYRNPQLPKELLEKEFMKSVDTLLNKAKINQLVYQHITEYLIDGFKKFGFDKIIDYIVENYLIEDDLCLDEQTENSIQRRIDQSKLLSVEAKAPNIIMPDKDGNVIDLSKIQSRQKKRRASSKTLMVFYASWCPHCKDLLPQLNKFSRTNKEIEILAISLDSKQKDWLKFINENCSELTNINDPNGWDGTVASDYYIYATPAMFLLDSEKKIIGKPTIFEELKDLL